jgi:acetyl-CoA acetyltransferase
MELLTPIRRTPGCGIDEGAAYIRGVVGAGLADEVQECYRAFANEVLRRHCARALVLGQAKVDAFHHLALRDALRAMSVAGLPSEFRIALVAETADLIAIYDTAVVEAARCGIDARRFLTALDAEQWLARP